MKAAPYAIGLLFIVAGALHFRSPRTYEAIVPPFLPAHRELVQISGFFEILGGVGAMLPATRNAAGYGLIALLIAVFPANIYMAVDSAQFEKLVPPWALYARLPLQFLMLWWVWTACVRERPDA